jgi:protein arginine N-methyltransferase 3
MADAADTDAAWGPDDDDAEWDEWGEDELGGQAGPAVDPFTGSTFPSAIECLQHMATVHGVDIVALATARGMDQYGCIRLINFLRKKV